MAINLDKQKAPGIIGIMCGAISSLLLGSVLGLIHLASLPVEMVNTLPKEPVEGQIYFVQGPPGGGSGRSWERKVEQLNEGGVEIAISAGDLNAWSSDNFKVAKVEQTTKDATVLILAGTPNFRIEDDKLQIGTINTLNFFGSERPLVFQARGGFERAASGWTYVPTEAYLGALPLHRAPFLLGVLGKRFGGASTLPDEVGRVLRDATELAVRDPELVVRMP